MVCLYGVSIEPGNYAGDLRFISNAPCHAALEGNQNPRKIVIYPLGKCLHQHLE